MDTLLQIKVVHTTHKLTTSLRDAESLSIYRTAKCYRGRIWCHNKDSDLKKEAKRAVVVVVKIIAEITD